jgi:hypothetical protein
VSKFVLILTLASACAFGCAKKDPFDQAFIEKDLVKRTAQEVHDAADKFTYDEPADHLLTEKQITDYIQVMKLTDRIRAVAERRANEQVDRASAAASGSARVGEALAVIGSVRSYATAELRACLNLGLNPKEHDWVGRHISMSLENIKSIVRLEDEITAKKAEMDAEIDPMLVTRKRHAYERAKDDKERWENSQDPAAMANAELVRKHRHELLPRADS